MNHFSLSQSSFLEDISCNAISTNKRCWSIAKRSTCVRNACFGSIFGLRQRLICKGRIGFTSYGSGKRSQIPSTFALLCTHISPQISSLIVSSLQRFISKAIAFMPSPPVCPSGITSSHVGTLRPFQRLDTPFSRFIPFLWHNIMKAGKRG